MKNKAIISLIIIAAMVLSTAIAFSASWSQSSGTINPSYGWQVLQGGFAGAFGIDGVYGTNSQYNNAARPVNVSNTGNFDLTIQVKPQGDLNKTIFAGITTATDPSSQSGWMVVGFARNSPFKVSSTGSDQLGNRTIGTALPTLGTTYTVHITSTDGGRTASFNVDGYSGSAISLALPSKPTYVIVHTGNNGTANPSFSNVPEVTGVSFTSPDNASVSVTPTPNATATPVVHSAPDVNAMRDFYAHQPVQPMSNQSVIYNPDGTIKQVIKGNQTTAPTVTAKPTVAAALNVTATPIAISPTPVASVPAPTKTKSPGFEIVLAAIGMMAALALVSRKR